MIEETQELEIPQSERLVLEYTISGYAGSSEAEFSANMAQIAISYLAQTVVHEAVGLSEGALEFGAGRRGRAAGGTHTGRQSAARR